MNSKLQILLVDDHPMFLDGMGLILTQQNADVFTAGNVQAALSEIDKKIKFDLIFVDLNLPGLDGYALITALRERQIFTPVIIISASEDHHDVSRALRYGALAYLPKSVDSGQISEAIKTVLAGEVYVAPELSFTPIQNRSARIVGLHKHKKGPGNISARQLEILKLVAEGYSNKEVGLALNIVEVTVKYHLNSVFGVLQVKNRTSCVKRAREMGLLNAV